MNKTSADAFRSLAASREEVAALKTERKEMRKRCGGENCIGWRLDHNVNWVSETLLQEARDERDSSRALVVEKDAALGHALHLAGHNRAMCARCREAKQRIADALALKEEEMNNG